MARHDAAVEGGLSPDYAVTRRQVEELGLTSYRYFPELKEEFDPEDPVDMARYAEVLKRRYARISYKDPVRRARRRQRSAREASAASRIKALKKSLATARAKLSRWEGVVRQCPRCSRHLSLEQIRNKQKFCDETCRLEYIGSVKPRCRTCKTLIGRNVRGNIKLYCGPGCRAKAGARRRADRTRAVRAVVCGCCGQSVLQKRTGKVRAFCDHKCRQRYFYWLERPLTLPEPPKPEAKRAGVCPTCRGPFTWKTRPKKFCSEKCGSIWRRSHAEG